MSDCFRGWPTSTGGGGGGSPGGIDTNVQFNDASFFGGFWSYEKAIDTLRASGPLNMTTNYLMLDGEPADSNPSYLITFPSPSSITRLNGEVDVEVRAGENLKLSNGWDDGSGTIDIDSEDEHQLSSRNQDIVLNPRTKIGETRKGVGINGIPDPSAILDLKQFSGTDRPQGFLYPPVTTLQRDSIITPSLGLHIYNTDLKLVEQFEGDVWVNIHTIKYTNKSGSPLVVGELVVMEATTNQAVTPTTGGGSMEILGIIVTPGANDAFITVARSGIFPVLCRANEIIAISDFLESSATTGQAREEPAVSNTTFAEAVEAGTDTIPFLVMAQLGGIVWS